MLIAFVCDCNSIKKWYTSFNSPLSKLLFTWYWVPISCDKFLKIEQVGIMKMAQWFRALPPLPEDLSSVPNIHIRLPTAIYNSRYRN